MSPQFFLHGAAPIGGGPIHLFSLYHLYVHASPPQSASARLVVRPWPFVARVLYGRVRRFKRCRSRWVSYPIKPLAFIQRPVPYSTAAHTLILCLRHHRPPAAATASSQHRYGPPHASRGSSGKGRQWAHSSPCPSRHHPVFALIPQQRRAVRPVAYVHSNQRKEYAP